MAHNVEPMDIDTIEGDFDNKENTFQHSNVLPRTPCTEKGYEELDVSELNMKLRYSITPASSPMSKSFTANCLDNKNSECPDYTSIDNANLTRSFNSMLTKNDVIISKSSKLQPLQLHMADQSLDNNRNASVLRLLDTTVTQDGNNVTLTVTEAHDIDENLSLPSSSSSALHTPEATTPTKDIPKNDGGSPIMRGLKSVLNMFRASQSPIPPSENEDNIVNHDISSFVDVPLSSSISSDVTHVALVSTPIAARNKRESSSKRGSPLKESIVFNEDLEKELLWKDETTILFSEEKIPIHKLFYPQTKNVAPQVLDKVPTANVSLNETVEFMDVSYNDSVVNDNTITESTEAALVAESDSEFVDCETTFTQQLDEEKSSKPDKEHTATLLSDVSGLNQTINKTAQELQTPTSEEEECNKESVNTTNTEGILDIANQDALEVSENKIKKINDSTIPLESNLNQETEDKLCMAIQKEPLDQSSFTIELQSGENALASSTFFNEVTQDITTQKDILPLDTTVIVNNKEEESVVSSTDIQEIGVNTSTQESKSLDATVSIELNDKPMSVSTFIINSTQNVTQITSNCINEPPHDTATIEDKPVPAPILSTEDKNVQLLSTNINNTTLIIDDKSNSNKSLCAVLDATIPASSSDNKVPSSSFTLNTTQDVEANLASDENYKTLDATITADATEKPASSTFITDITQDIESHTSTPNAETYLACDRNVEIIEVTEDSTEKPVSSTFIKDITQDFESNKSADNMQTSLDTVKLLDAENKPISSTFVSGISQDRGIELSDIPITTESMQILTSPTRDFTHVIDSEVAMSHKNNILNSANTNIETYTSSKDLGVTLSIEKSLSLSEDSLSQLKTQQVSDPQVVSDCIESTADVTLNNGASVDGEEKVNFVFKTQSPTDTCKATDVISPMVEAEITVIREEEKIIKEQVKPKESPEYNNCYKIQSTDIRNSSGDAAKLLMDKPDASDSDLDNPVKVTLFEAKGSGESLPVNIPLPDEDDIEMEPLSTDQLAIENNATNSGVISDVIHDLDFTKVQDANQIDEMPINKIDHVKVPADLITDTLSIKTEVLNCDYKILLNCDYKILTENNSTCVETKNSEQIEKVILSEDVIDSTQSIQNNNINEKSDGSISSDSKVPKSAMLPKSMDISYINHNISSHKDSACEVQNKNISAIDHGQSNQNMTNETKETSGNEKSSGILEKHSNLPEEYAQIQNVSIDNMEIDIPSWTTNTENDKISGALQLNHKSENDVERKNQVIHEEIIVNENNSPYVLVSVEKEGDKKNDRSIEEDFENIDNPFDSKSKTSTSSPSSPPIASKGYNFNFDEIDDPFATKTKIRTSPPLDSPKQIIRSEEKVGVSRKDTINKNKRKSYPVRPKSAVNKNNFNNSFDGTLSTQCTTDKSNIIDKKRLAGNDVSVKKSGKVTEVLDDNINTVINVIEKSELEHNIDNTSKSVALSESLDKHTNLENKSPEGPTSSEVTNDENKSLTSTGPSSSDQSIYLSAGTSGDSIKAKNVFNLPEIDDMNFNPFATKSKINLSPPPSLEISEPICTEIELDFQSTTENANVNAVDTLHNFSQQNKSGHDEKNSSYASNTTCSSKDDKNTTVREVHTDDDDTIEGPFLDTEDNEITELGLRHTIKNKEVVGLDLENDMMEFSDIPAQDNEDNELFIDAAAYEFLLNQNKSNVVMDSGKESLFLKFDPLFAKRLSSEGIAAALSKLQKKQSTPKKMTKIPPLASLEHAVAGPSTSNVSPQQLDTTEDIAEDLNITTSKPMMVVTPAVNPIVKPRKATTPASSNRRSITFTSPAIAVIDRLLSLSANNSLVDQNSTITHVSREHDEAELALTQLRELLAEKEINVYNLRSESKELKDRLLTLESQMRVLETESEERLKKVNELNEKLTEKSKINKSMAAVVEEYERTIASLIAETEQDRKRHEEERAKLVKERDEQTAHLASMEVSFSDLHSKYEKSKQIILSCKANEDTYKKSIKEFEENLSKMQNNYETLKQHATAKLNHANQELEKMNKAHESEVLKLNAMIKRKELHLTSLEETLAQKTKANEELTAICDELINKVG